MNGMAYKNRFFLPLKTKINGSSLRERGSRVANGLRARIMSSDLHDPPSSSAELSEKKGGEGSH